MAYTPPKSGAPHQFETGDSPTAGPSFQQPAFTDISGTATNSQLAGPLVNGVTVGVGGDFTLSKTDPLAVGNETLTPGNVTATHLSSPLPVTQGGTGDATLTAHGLLIGEGTSAVAATAAGTAGQIPVSGGAAADPSYVTPTAGTGLSVTANATTHQYALSTPVTVANGGTGASTLTAHGVLLGEGTSAVTPTGTQTAGQVLVGQGATLDPLWKSVSGDATLSSAGVVALTPATGTWTPTIRGNSTAGTATYSIQYGRYIKIGPLVIADFYVAWSTFTGAAGTLQVAGLPFPNASQTNNFTENHISDLVGITYGAGYTHASLEIAPGASVADLLVDGSGQPVSYPPVGNIAGVGNIIGTLIYRNA